MVGIGVKLPLGPMVGKCMWLGLLLYHVRLPVHWGQPR